MIEFLAAIGFVLAAIAATAWWRVRARCQQTLLGRAALEESRAGLAAVLDTAPNAALWWRRDSGEECAIGSVLGSGAGSPYSRFLAALTPTDAARLGAGVDQLRETGTPFDDTVSLAAGSDYRAHGAVTASGDAVLWLTDVSGKRTAEQSGKAAEQAAAALRQAFNAIPLPVWRRDRTLRLIDCNNAYAGALDSLREAVLGDSRELATESGREKARALARAAAIGTIKSERRHIVIGGSRRLLEVCELPDGSGGTIGFAVDRTDLESAETELARHINAHGQVLENIHAAVAIYGADKHLSFFNSAFARLWSIEEDWLAAHPSLDEILERLRERRRIPEFADFRLFKRQQLGLFTSLIEPQHELMHLPDGRTLSVSMSPHPLGGLLFVYEDVTDRLALERSYNTLIEVQRETLDNLYEGIALFGSDGRLKLHNPAYRKIWSFLETDLEGEPHISDIVERTRRFYDDGGDWPTMRQQIIANITQATPTNELLDRRDGSVLQLATVPLPDGNVLVTALDVTDTARVERVLRERNDALETTGRLKSEFIANVSYELRTPLNAIIGFAEILANQYFGPLSDRQLEYSRGILDSSHRLMSLINDILDLATIEAGYMALETGPVDIRAMLQAIMTLTRERARNRDLALTLRCPRNIGVIDADERRLKQALFNLISNAIKFTPAGGSIRLEARREGSEVILAVTDTGVGIPDADHERVFEKFERGDPQARESGAGLGLSLVKSLVELHGGTVSIESRPNTGTTIACHLPATPAPAAEEQPAALATGSPA
ncbi:MAG: PAS-domain containing protein [Alphaproteobacteria bacterium]|nr:PAS-domain containing protein [Alphaproteobacteria bacterium]